MKQNNITIKICSGLIVIASLLMTGCASGSRTSEDKPDKAQLFVQAAWDNDVTKVKQMIDGGIDVNIVVSKVVTPITGAHVVNGQIALESENPGWQNAGCFTALSAAKYKGNEEVVKVLQQAGAK